MDTALAKNTRLKYEHYYKEMLCDIEDFTKCTGTEKGKEQGVGRNIKLGDKIPTKIKHKDVDRTTGGEAVGRGKGEKKPGDRIPTKIKEKRAKRTTGGKTMKGKRGTKKPGDKIPTEIKEKLKERRTGGEAVVIGEENEKPGDKINTGFCFS